MANVNDFPDILLHRVAERARDPRRRYMSAAEEEQAVKLSAGDAEQRMRAWTADLVRRAAALSGEQLSDLELEQRAKSLHEQQGTARRMVEEQMRAWGMQPPTSGAFVQGADHVQMSSSPPGASLLPQPPKPEDWEFLELAAAQLIPLDLRRLYLVADGGFGPGFTGLYSVKLIASNCLDLRRRGPDYCNSIEYPQSYLPLAEEMLAYHYDIDTGRIISSNPNWANEDLEPEDIYDVAFQSLAAMMEDWLARS